MTKIKTDYILKDFEGKEIKNGDNNLTVGSTIGIVLGAKTDNPTLAWTLGKKFYMQKEVELKAEDVVFIKNLLEKTDIWNSIVTGQLIEILESTGKDSK